MLTKNWYTALAFYMAGNSSYDAIDFPFVDYQGRTHDFYSHSISSNDNPPICLMPLGFNGSYFVPNSGQDWSAAKVLLGDGNAEPTLDDYNLSGNQITTIENLSWNHQTTFRDGAWQLTSTFTVKNTGTEPFTVREIGWGGRQYYGSNQRTLLLYARSLLREPVTVPPGEVGVVTFELTLAIPVAQTENQ